MAKKTFISAVAAVALLLTAGQAAGATLFGTAVKQGGVVKLAADRSKATAPNRVSGIRFTVPTGLTVAQLKTLGATFKLTRGACSRLSPRFEIHLQSGQSVLVALGPCAPNRWTSPGNLIGLGDARWDTSQLKAGTQSNTYAGTLELVGSQPISSISLVVEAGRGFTATAAQTVFVRGVVVAGAPGTVSQRGHTARDRQGDRDHRLARSSNSTHHAVRSRAHDDHHAHQARHSPGQTVARSNRRDDGDRNRPARKNTVKVGSNSPAADTTRAHQANSPTRRTTTARSKDREGERDHHAARSSNSTHHAVRGRAHDDHHADRARHSPGQTVARSNRRDDGHHNRPARNTVKVGSNSPAANTPRAPRANSPTRPTTKVRSNTPTARTTETHAERSGSHSQRAAAGNRRDDHAQQATRSDRREQKARNR